MQLINNPGSGLIRRNAHMRSLWIEYPRIGTGDGIMAILLNRDGLDRSFKLPVLTAGPDGIEIKLPSFLTGMFYLKIEDGEQSFLRQIALQ